MELFCCSPSGGARNGAPSVHQHAPAVTSGLVALDRLVEPQRPAVRDEDGLPRILSGFVQSALPLLVTRRNLL